MFARSNITLFTAFLACLVVVRGNAACEVESNGEPMDDALDVRYMETLTKVLQARLERAQKANERQPGVFSQHQVELLELYLRATQLTEQKTREQGRLDWFPFFLAFVEATRVDAELDLQRAQELRRRNVGVISKLDLRILRLESHLARLNLDRGKRAASGTEDERRSWATEVLLIEIKQLQDRTALLQQRN